MPPLAFAVALAACSALPPAAPTRPAPGATAAPESPTLAFVARARPGEKARVTDPAMGGAVVIELEAAYHSASNRDCRRFSVSLASPLRRETRYACFSGDRLELVTLY